MKRMNDKRTQERMNLRVVSGCMNEREKARMDDKGTQERLNLRLVSGCMNERTNERERE